MKKKIFLIAAITFIIDIISKIIIDFKFDFMNSVVIVKDFFYLSKVYNDGASWSMFSGLPILLIIVTIILLIILIIYQRKFQENKRNTLAFGRHMYCSRYHFINHSHLEKGR